ncbi:hypothetical protein NHQ30_003724 [Ciborinia camelliae]|nr:hypothetical protein NHQ30_003724 [Ciborinia camelliae]
MCRTKKKIKITADQPATEPTEALSLSPDSQPGIVGTELSDGTQNPAKNTIIMKNSLGEDIEMSLDFGPMRKGPPETDDEDSEEEKEAEAAVSKKDYFRARYSKMKSSNFLSKGGNDPKEEELNPRPKVAVTREKEVAIPKGLVCRERVNTWKRT